MSTHEVLSFVEELGKKVRGPSTVIGVSVAAKVRSRFRAGRSAETGVASRQVAAPRQVAGTSPVAASRPVAAVPRVAAPPPALAGGQSLFLPPVPPPAPTAFAAGADPFVNPFAVPDAGPDFQAPASRPRAALPLQRPDAPRSPAPVATAAVVAAPLENFDELWRGRGLDADDQQTWCSAGIRPRDAALADQCRSIGIEPADLPRKLSGRTVLQRLRDGESTTSVWARIQEAEQQPRRAGTKLTGRFQLS